MKKASLIAETSAKSLGAVVINLHYVKTLYVKKTPQSVMFFDPATKGRIALDTRPATMALATKLGVKSEFVFSKDLCERLVNTIAKVRVVWTGYSLLLVINPTIVLPTTFMHLIVGTPKLVEPVKSYYEEPGYCRFFIKRARSTVFTASVQRSDYYNVFSLWSNGAF